jgi:hypothetical protein
MLTTASAGKGWCAVIPNRLSLSCALTLSTLFFTSVAAFAQSADLQGELSSYQTQLDQNKSELSRDEINETSDERLMRHLKTGGVKYAKEEALLAERIDKEKFYEFECQNNIRNLQSWIVYDQSKEQQAAMQAQYDRHNAYEATIDADVARRNAYPGPAVTASASSSSWGGGTGWGAYGYGSGSGYIQNGRWMTYPHVHWHSSHHSRF